MSIRQLAMALMNFLPDRLYLSIQYRYHTGKRLKLNPPIRYNEKLQWIKLYDRNPRYTDLVDKYKVKTIVAKTIGEEYVVPLLAVWDRPEQISISKLPKRFVLKTNHDSKGVLICKDKMSFDLDYAKAFFSSHMRHNGYSYGREWPYKNVERKIIAEQFLDAKSEDLVDYKVMCFNGKARLIQLHQGRFTDHYTHDIFDVEWNRQPFNQFGEKASDKVVEKPIFLDEMIRLSEKLAFGIPHVRVDWYYVDNHLFFGEMTFFDASGYLDFIPEKYNEIIGSWINLPEKQKRIF